MKITKSELLRRIEALEEWSSGADEMLTELNHALPDPEYDAKCEAVADIEASLDRHRERLGLNKSELTGGDLPELPKAGDFFEIIQHHSQKLPRGKVLEVAKVNHNTNQIKFVGGFNGYFTDFDRSVYLGGAEDEPMKPCAKPEQAELKLKQLDQSMFEHYDDCWRFLAVDKNGSAWRYREKPHVDDGYALWLSDITTPTKIGEGYDTTNWQNSLIERESKELTGSELCKAMLINIKKPVMCKTPNGFDLIKSFRTDGDKYFFHGEKQGEYSVVTPVNNQGEPLTASEVEL